MFAAVPPLIGPTFAVDSSSIRPSRISAIARAAAAIADRPSSGYIPACAARPWNVISSCCADGAPSTIVADRRRLVVDVADAARGAGDGRTRRRRCSPTSSFGVNSELDPGVRPALGEHAARRLEHRGDRGLVVAAEDRRPRVADDAVLDDRLDRVGRRHGVEVGAEEDRLALGASARPARRGSPSSSRPSARRRPRRPRARSRGDTRRRGRRPRAPRPDGLEIAASSRKRSSTSDTPRSYVQAIRARARASARRSLARRCRSRERARAASTNSRNSGAGRVGRDLNSGWNCDATNHG